MSGWSLEVEAFQLQTPYLASPAVTHLLSPTFLPPSSLLPFLERVDSGSSASTLDSSLPHPMGLAPRLWLLRPPAPFQP